MQNARNLVRIIDRSSLAKLRRNVGTFHTRNDRRGLSDSRFNAKVLVLPSSNFTALYSPHGCRYFATAQAKPAEQDVAADPSTSDYHSIITDKEKVIGGPAERHQFQAETKMLLDIVAKSLYSEKEVKSINTILLQD